MSNSGDLMNTNVAAAVELVIKNLGQELAKALPDPKINLRIASLVGDDHIALYSTVLKPGNKITAHSHKYGVELYYILNGVGEVYTGTIQESTKEVDWNLAQGVKSGDSFCINPGVVHQLKNTSRTDCLALIFVCPPSHLLHDRIIIQDYE